MAARGPGMIRLSSLAGRAIVIGLGLLAWQSPAAIETTFGHDASGNRTAVTIGSGVPPPAVRASAPTP